MRSRSGERKQFSSPKGNHVSQEVRTKKRPLSDKHCEQKKPSPPKKRPSVEFQDANVSKILDFAENEAAVNTVIFSPVKQTKSSKCSLKSSKVKEAHCDPEESSESEGLSPELRHDKQPVEITKATGKKFRSCKATKLVPFDAALSIPKEVAKKKKKKIVPKESSKSTASKIKKVIVTPVDLSERTFYTMDRIQPMTEGIVDDEVGCNDWFRDLAHRQVTFSSSNVLDDSLPFFYLVFSLCRILGQSPFSLSGSLRFLLSFMNILNPKKQGWLKMKRDYKFLIHLLLDKTYESSHVDDNVIH